MKIRIVYHSSHGNTHLVAKSIAAGFHSHDHQVELHPAKDFNPELAADCDLLGIGSAVYVWKHAEVIENILEQMPDLFVKPAFLFVTYSGDPGNTLKYMRDKLAKRRAKVLAAHKCLGEESYPWLRSRFRVPAKGHPDEHDLDTAAAFADRVLQSYEQFVDDPVGFAGLDFPFNRDLFYYMSLAAPFGDVERTIGRRSCDYDRCTRCGECVKRCPASCIEMGQSGPIFHEGCIGCCGCYNLCPEGAIQAVMFPGRRNRYRGRWNG
ncbi:MAG: EFR1 family ferrodoxin [Candidatus Alcyoniella australis]|nr:EFR1 family ferrodoxin [Candidatus Alcyoniella australis]